MPALRPTLQAVELEIEKIRFPTFNEALDMMVLTRMKQLWAFRSGRSARDVLLGDKAGHYVPLFTLDEIRDFRRRNNMPPVMPDEMAKDFVSYIEPSLFRTGILRLILPLGINVAALRDREGIAHLVFFDDPSIGADDIRR
jgi:hypothetical protein